jgi:Uma2 family endonuclease
MTIGTIKMTAEQFMQLGRDPAGTRLELVDGEIAVSPSPNPQHARVVLQLAMILGRFVEDKEAGELLLDVDTFFGEYDVRRPDLLYFQKSRTALVTRKRLRGRPDLAVEVISESSADTDRGDKFKQYAKGGVKFYWILDPAEESFEAYVLKSGRYSLFIRGECGDTVSAPPFKDLAIPLRKLWWPK